MTDVASNWAAAKAAMATVPGWLGTTPRVTLTCFSTGIIPRTWRTMEGCPDPTKASCKFFTSTTSAPPCSASNASSTSWTLTINSMPEAKLLLPSSQEVRDVAGTAGTGTRGLSGSSSSRSSDFSTGERSASGKRVGPAAMPINSAQCLTRGTGSAPLYLVTVLVHQVSDSSFNRRR